LNPHTGEISPITGMNTKTSEKSPDRGSHASTIAGVPRPSSTKFGSVKLQSPRPGRRVPRPGVSELRRGSGARGLAGVRDCWRSCPVFCLVRQGDGPQPEFVQGEEAGDEARFVWYRAVLDECSGDGDGDGDERVERGLCGAGPGPFPTGRSASGSRRRPGRGWSASCRARWRG
jgi:hypothetical protein